MVLKHVVDVESEQPTGGRELSRGAIVPATIDAERARVTGKRLLVSWKYLTVRTVAGDVFEIVRSRTSEELEDVLMTWQGRSSGMKNREALARLLARLGISAGNVEQDSKRADQDSQSLGMSRLVTLR